MATPQKQIARMDRSRPYATVHGERAPGDRHVNVHFFQNGLPFDAAGVLVVDHPDVTESPDLKAKAAKLLAKAAKVKQTAPGDDAAADSDDEDEGGADGPVNLETWAKGQERFEWQDVSNAIAARFNSRVTNKTNAVELLVKERVVAPGALSAEHRALIGLT